MMKILFAASEAVPFIKTGGLADVVGSLPKYFDKEKYDVRVMIPKYLCIRQELREKMKFVEKFYVKMNWRTQYVGVDEMEYDGVKYYFIDNEYYFAGPKPYGEMYQDSEKFAYFSRAVLESLPVIGFQPDLIHCHDWQTGLIPVHLKVDYKDNEFYKNIKTVMTIHNLKFQGRWDIDKIKDFMGISDYYFTDDILLCSVLGGVGIGFALGLVIRSGASTGGMDIPPLLIHKFFGIDVAKGVMFTDAATVLFGLYIYGLEAVLIGLISVYMTSIAISKAMTYGTTKAKSVQIISNHYLVIS